MQSNARESNAPPFRKVGASIGICFNYVIPLSKEITCQSDISFPAQVSREPSQRPTESTVPLRRATGLRGVHPAGRLPLILLPNACPSLPLLARKKSNCIQERRARSRVAGCWSRQGLNWSAPASSPPGSPSELLEPGKARTQVHCAATNSLYHSACCKGVRNALGW